MKGHRRVALATVVALVLAVTGCVRSEQGLVNAGGPITQKNLPPCPLGALAEADGPVTVEVWHALAGKSKDQIDELGRAFNSSQSKVRVEVKSQGTDYDEVLRKYQAAIPSRQLPGIVYIEDQNLRLMVDTGSVLPAESCMKADGSDPGFLPAVRNYYTADDVFWPGYVNVSEPVLYYNVNHFKRAGLDPAKPPLTFDEVEAAAKKLKAAGIAKPLALKMDLWFVEAWINGAGGSLVNMDNGRSGNPTRAEIDNPISLRVFRWIKDMLDQGLIDPVSDTPGQINQYLALANQTSSMTVETSTAATTIKAFLGGEDVGQGGVDTGGAEADLSTLLPAAGPFPGLEEPGRVRISGGAFYMTNTPSPAEQAGAWAFMRFMQEVPNQVSWHLVGSYLPTTEAAAADPEIEQFWEDDLAGRMLKVAHDELLLVDPERPGPALGPYPQYDAAVRNALESMVFNGATPEAAVAQAQRDIDEILAEYIEDNAPG